MGLHRIALPFLVVSHPSDLFMFSEYTFVIILISPMYVTCLPHLNLDLMILIKFGDDYKS
jgi:hypothetical protein